MERTRFDLTARRVARLDPLGFFAWLLTDFEQHLRFAGWLDPRSTPPGTDPEVTGDTLARLEELAGDAPPWMFPVEFQTVPDPGMFGRLQNQVGLWWEDLRPDPLPDSRSGWPSAWPARWPSLGHGERGSTRQRGMPDQQPSSRPAKPGCRGKTRASPRRPA